MHDLERHGPIKKHDQDLLTEYDVTEKGFIVNEQPRTLEAIGKAIIEEFKAKGKWGKYGHEYLDYFSTMGKYNEAGPLIFWPYPWKWTAVYWVTGGSEGYYIHVDAIDTEGKRTMVFLGKAWNKAEARETVRILEDFFQV